MVKKPLNKILLILLGVFLLPICIFTVYQISTLNENERVITEIYDKQLEAILFSVNQYSQDLVDNWARELDQAEFDTAYTNELMLEFLLENDAVRYILWSDSTLQNNHLWSLDDEENPEVKSLLTDTLISRRQQLTTLSAFKRERYIKKEPLGRLESNGDLSNLSGLLFLLERGKRYQVCFIIMDPSLFITRNLALRIQSVAQENFIISAYDEVNNVQVAVMDSIKGQLPHKKPLWLLPDYSLGIVLKGETIQSLAQNRTVNNLLILLGVDLILLVGLWMVYRNIRRR